MNDNKPYAFFKGNFVPLEQANINILNHAFRYGTAIFEGIRGYWRQNEEQMYLFRAHEHFERMFDSMKILYMEVPYTIDELIKIVVELVKLNNQNTDIYIRPQVYGASLRVGPALDDTPAELCITIVPFGSYFREDQGLKCTVSNWRRVEDNAIPARAKIVGAYVNTALAKTDALKAGYDDCIVLSENGHVSEGSAMNLFMVKKGQLITTPGTENILEGITRNCIMEFTKSEFGLETQIRSIDRSELYICDELFFCGTAAQVGPIRQVDQRTIGDGKIGPITKKISDTYTSICHGEMPKYNKWLTPVYSKIGDKNNAST